MATLTYDGREWAVERTGDPRRPFVLRGKRGAVLELVRTVGPLLYPMRGGSLWPGAFRVTPAGDPEAC